MDFVRGREVLRETREEVAKSGEVLRESRLVFFEWSGEGEKNHLLSSLSSPAKVEIRAKSKQKLPVKLIFSAKTEISGESFSQAEEKNTPKKVVFAPKVAEMDEKRRFGVGNHREGMKRKIELYCQFCHAMK